MDWITKLLQIKVADKYRGEFTQHNIEINSHRTLVLSVVVIVLESVILGMTFMNETKAIYKDYLGFYRGMYSLAILVALMTVFLVGHYSGTEHKHKNLILTTVLMMDISIFLNWAMLISIVDGIRGSSSLVYMFISLATSVIIIMRPLRGFVLYGSSWFLYCLLTWGVILDPSIRLSNYVNGTSFIFTAWVISMILYNFRADGFSNQKIIGEQHQLLKDAALRDPLTGLYNRRSLEDVLDSIVGDAIRDGHTITVMMADVDWYKGYNDTYGHIRGDQVLVAVTKALKDTIGGVAIHLSRYGGDEFCIIYKGLSQGEVVAIETLLEEGVKRLEIPNKASLTEDVLTISIGSYRAIPYDKVDGWYYINKADEALYSKKSRRMHRRKEDG